MNNTIREYFDYNPWFRQLNQAQLDGLLAIARPVHWPDGAFIFREGQVDTNLYLIVSGRVALEVYVPNRGRATILTVGPDESFGWSAVTPAVSMKTVTARAVLDTEAIAFDTQALRDMSEADHEFGYLFYSRMSNVVSARLSTTRMQLLDMYAVRPEGDEP